MTHGISIPELERRLAAAPSSALFARLAHALLSSGEALRAEALCARGLEEYPRYSTGRLVRARCLAARGHYQAALFELGKISSLYPGNVLLAGLEEEWRASAEVATTADDGAYDVGGVPAAHAPAVAPAIFEAGIFDAEVVEVLPLADDVPSAAAPVTTPDEAPARDHTEVLQPEGVDPPLPVPGRRAFPVPILPPIPAPLERISFLEPDRIVSRTLAEIYASQGAITEAVETYRLLLGRISGGNDMMEARLRELEERMKSTPAGPRRSVDE